MVAVHISKHSLFRLKITDDCRLCTCPSIHFSLDEDTLKITVGCLVCVYVVLCVGFWWCVCVCFLLWWCLCVVCGEAWHTLSLLLSLLPLLFPFRFPFLFLSYLYFSLFFFFFFFSCSFSYSCSCSCYFSFSSLSPLLATKHYGKNQSTNTAANIEAFECDLAQGKCTAVGSLPPPLPSLLPSPPPLLKKRKLFITGIFRRGNYFVLKFKLIQKNQRRVKLQSLQFYINSKTINLHHVKSVIILAKMVHHILSRSCQHKRGSWFNERRKATMPAETAHRLLLSVALCGGGGGGRGREGEDGREGGDGNWGLSLDHMKIYIQTTTFFFKKKTEKTERQDTKTSDTDKRES